MDGDIEDDRRAQDEDDDMETESSSYWNQESEDDISTQKQTPKTSFESSSKLSRVEQKNFDESKNEYDNGSNEEVTLTEEDNVGHYNTGMEAVTTIKAIDRNVVHQICSGQVSWSMF